MTSYIGSTPTEWESWGFTHHDNGYLYKEITPINFFFELVLIVWPPGTCSKAHDHGSSHNLTWLLPLGNATLRTTLFKVSQNQLQVDRTNTIAGNQLHYVAKYQAHEVANESLHTAVTMHLYYPSRHR